MKTITRFVAALVIAGAAALPSIASAQVSVQLYWGPNNQPYYYGPHHHRHYLSVAQARDWARREDPQWYRHHERDWRSNPQGFAHAYVQHHNERYGRDNGDRDRYDRGR